MATFCAKLGAAACIAGTLVLASTAHACDERFPWTCKPAPSTAASEPAESSKTTAKPLQITTRRRGSNAKTAKTSERSAHVNRKRLARKAAPHRSVVRARHAKAVAAVPEDDSRPGEDTARPTPGEAFNKAVAEPRELGRKDSPRSSRSTRVADGSTEGSPGFASMWKDRMVAAEPVELPAPRESAAAAAEPATNPAQRPLPVVAQDEVNDMDLAAAAAPATADSFWLRGLFLALGGLLAVGSAVRFLM
jgi:hypothetical protein